MVLFLEILIHGIDIAATCDHNFWVILFNNRLLGQYDLSPLPNIIQNNKYVRILPPDRKTQQEILTTLNIDVSSILATRDIL